MKTQPLIAVNDIPVSSQWYQRLLNCQSEHSGDEYEQLIGESGEMILHGYLVVLAGATGDL